MTTLQSRPSFGGKLKQPEFYASVDSILAVLRPTATLRVMAEHLNRAGFTTPSGLIWTRSRVASYLRTTTLN